MPNQIGVNGVFETLSVQNFIMRWISYTRDLAFDMLQKLVVSKQDQLKVSEFKLLKHQMAFDKLETRMT
jgi:hypothetical protein